MPTRRALTVLLVCLTLCVSTSAEAGQEATVHELSQQDNPVAKIAKAVHMVGLAAKAKKPDVQLVNQAAKLAKAPALVPMVSKSTNAGSDPHDSKWHCAHCSKTCTTLKCKSWCEEQWCNKIGDGGSPLFTKTSMKVPANAGNNWHCSHCNSQCKTGRCNNWCKRMWCAMDADGNPIGWNAKNLHGIYRSPSIHGGKNAMKLLSITRTGSPKLKDMEQNANRIIGLCNRDITGKMMGAAFKAVDSVIAQRGNEVHRFKEGEEKSNEADQKRFSKDKYAKWDAEKDALDGADAEQEIQAAKESEAKDKANEIKFKTEGKTDQAAEKDAEKEVEKAEEEEEDQEKKDAEVDKEHAENVDPEQAIYHMKQPSEM